MSHHKVHCFSCAVTYDQSGPHPHCCGSCGSDDIGVRSTTSGDVWSIAVVGDSGPLAMHSAMAPTVGDVVQSLVDDGIDREHVIVVSSPEAGPLAAWSVHLQEVPPEASGPGPVDLRRTQEMEFPQ